VQERVGGDVGVPIALIGEFVRVREQAVLHMQEGKGRCHILTDQAMGDIRRLCTQDTR
jgi:hypothetical protein